MENGAFAESKTTFHHHHRHPRDEVHDFCTIYLSSTPPIHYPRYRAYPYGPRDQSHRSHIPGPREQKMAKQQQESEPSTMVLIHPLISQFGMNNSALKYLISFVSLI